MMTVKELRKQWEELRTARQNVEEQLWLHDRDGRRTRRRSNVAKDTHTTLNTILEGEAAALKLLTEAIASEG